MSDIDDLEAIVESTHFGRSPNALFTGSRSKLQKSFETCKRGHDLNHAYPVETHSRKNLLDVEVMYETRLG